MVNNIVYFGRIITTILLICPIRPIRLISLIRLIRPICLIRLISLIRPIHLVRLSATLAPLSRHSRATLVPLRFFRFLRLPSVGLQTPETGLPPVPKVPKDLRDLRDLRDPFPLGRTVSFSNPVQRYFKSPLCVPLMVKIFPKKCIFCVFLPLHKTI